MYDIAIIGGDMRQVYMIPMFRQKNLSVITYGLTYPMMKDICSQGKTMKETIKSSMVLVSSIPFSKDGIVIPSLTSPFDMTTDCFFDATLPKQMLFAGMISPTIRNHCSEHQVSYYDFMEDDCIAIANGIATAEGAIMEAISKSSGNLHKSQCLVLGFGKCAKTLAMKLKGLDAFVTIGARKASDLALSNALGFETITLNCLNEILPSYDYIFNSIPALILDNDLLCNISKETIIIDIASSPGGLNYKKAKELNLNANLCLGIPGKISPKASAQILSEKVFDYISNRKKG